MFDNGLLQYYRKKAYQDGILDAKDIKLKKVKRMNTIESSRVYLCKSAVGKLYSRGSSLGSLDKDTMDSNILLSQIYNKVGLKSAVYTPAKLKNKIILLSNNVQEENDASAYWLYNHNSEIMWQFIAFMHSKKEKETALNYMEESVLQNLAKVSLYNTVCFNDDCHFGNIFLHCNKAGKVDDIKYIDLEFEENAKNFNFDYNICANIPSYNFCQDDTEEIFKDKNFSETTFYYNYFSNLILNRNAMLQEFETNDLFAETVNKKALAKELASVNPVAVAKDVKETIGYEINPKIPDFLARSCEDVANLLTK